MSFKRKSSKKLLIAVLTAVLCIAVFITLFYFAGGNPLDISGNEGEDYVKILDVGQGDSILIHSNGKSALIDAGPPEGKVDMLIALKNSHIENIDVLILTHLHLDHTGGVTSLTENYGIDNLILPTLETESKSYDDAKTVIDYVSRTGGNIYGAVQGMNFNLGDFEITILSSYSDMFDQNDRSLVIMAKLKNRKFLFMGDAEKPAEQALLEEGLNLDCDVLKVGHHGSSSSTSAEFLLAATPDYAAICVGRGNEFYHPHKKVLNALKKANVKIFRTDKNGDIKFLVENNRITVESEK